VTYDSFTNVTGKIFPVLDEDYPLHSVAASETAPETKDSNHFSVNVESHEKETEDSSSQNQM
jgi:hypothetical protein